MHVSGLTKVGSATGEKDLMASSRISVGSFPFVLYRLASFLVGVDTAGIGCRVSDICRWSSISLRRENSSISKEAACW